MSKFLRRSLYFYQRVRHAVSLSKIKTNCQLKEDSCLHGFVVQRIKHITEFNLDAIILKHEKTGAEYLHIQKHDQNNVFGILFRTPSPNSTGVAHILEHTVLCGSKLYPVRDPFFKMLNRSLATFMNAMTGNDYTLYPFATQNFSDYKNLMSVYLDAVFNPNLKELDFNQEGWRIENENPGDPNSPFLLKGVVLNEMKAVFADPQQLFSENLQTKLFPDNVYANVSGGHPLKIPFLTWEELCSFHSKYYHPSKAKFFSYGNFPLESHLEFLNERYLSEYTVVNKDDEIPLQKKWSEPRFASIDCADFLSSDASKETVTVGLSYLLLPVTEVYENFVLQVISALLIGGSNSPFYQSLLERNLGDSFVPATGYSNNTKQSTFTIGLQGVLKDNAKQVSEKIRETFHRTAQEGFTQQRIDSILHSLEIQLKHEKADFGIHVLFGLVSLWNHNVDVITALECDELISRLRNDLIRNPKFLQDKISEYFIKNTHSLELNMSPNKDYERNYKEKEDELLKTFTKHLTLKDKEHLCKKSKELAQMQESVSNVDCLPILQRKDIDRCIKKITRFTQNIEDTNVLFIEQFTNNLTYFQIFLNFSMVPDNLRNLVPLFCAVFSKMGTKNVNFKALEEMIDLKTGGLSVDPFIRENPQDILVFEEGLSLHSYCLNTHLSSMFDIWLDLFNNISFQNVDQLVTLIKMISTDLSNGIVHNAHSYAMSYSSSHFRRSCALREQFVGISQLHYLKNLVNNLDIESIQKGLETIAAIVLNKEHMRCAINAEKHSFHETSNLLDNFLQKIKGHAKTPIHTHQEISEDSAHKCHFVCPLPINFTALSYPSFSYANPKYAYLRIVSKLLSAKYLHSKIREQGGAYGSGAVAFPTGVFSFYSYRDPNSTQTFKEYQKSLEWLLEASFSQQDIDEAVLRVFQEEDKPVAPGFRGLEGFYWGLTDEMKQSHRNHLLNATKADLVDATVNLLKSNSVGCCTLIGPENVETKDTWTISQL